MKVDFQKIPNFHVLLHRVSHRVEFLTWCKLEIRLQNAEKLNSKCDKKILMIFTSFLYLNMYVHTVCMKFSPKFIKQKDWWWKFITFLIKPNVRGHTMNVICNKCFINVLLNFVRLCNRWSMLSTYRYLGSVLRYLFYNFVQY